MKRTVRSSCLALAALAVLLSDGRSLHAQATATATGPGSLMAIGGEASYYETVYGQQKLGGVGLFAEVDPAWWFGVEAEVRYVRFGADENVTERTYLAGPRITLSKRPGRLRPYAKFLIGSGHINLPFNYGVGNYLVYAPGGGLDYTINDRWTVRVVDAEYQMWPQFTFGSIHPYGISAGIAFRLNPVELLPKHATEHRW